MVVAKPSGEVHRWGKHFFRQLAEALRVYFARYKSRGTFHWGVSIDVTPLRINSGAKNSR